MAKTNWGAEAITSTKLNAGLAEIYAWQGSVNGNGLALSNVGAIGCTSVTASGDVVTGANIGVGTPTPDSRVTILNDGPNGLKIGGASTNSIGMVLDNTVTGGAGWSLSSSGVGPSPLGCFTVWQNGVGARMTISKTGLVTLSATPVHADNAAAVAAGLGAGAQYRTSTGVRMEVY